MKNTLGSPPAASGLLGATTELQPESTLLWPTLCLLSMLLVGAALFLGGIEAATILLAALIGALALIKPRSALWASTAFMVYLFVFFQRAPMFGPELPSEFYYWGAGVSIITVGLCLALLQKHHGLPIAAKTPFLARFDRAMLLMFLVCLVSSIYGVSRGNSLFAVARQLFGCVLLPVYYLFGRSLLRTAEDVNHWLHRVSWAAAAGAAWYVAKLGFISLSEGTHYREQSHLASLAGVIGAVLIVEFLQDQRFWERVRSGVAIAWCVLVIVLMGARVVAGSLAATTIVFTFLHWRKRRLTARFLTLLLFALAISFAVPAFDQPLQEPGVLGQIASRFSPFQLDEDLSYVGRVAQWQAVVDVIKHHPILGAGMGAEVSFFSPDFPEVYGRGAFIDNGWGFVLLKMGLVGLSVFLFLIGAFLWFATRSGSEIAPGCPQHVRKCLLAILLFGLLSFIGGPTFFHFTQSGFLGTALGGLAVLAGTTTPTGRSRHPQMSGV
ncbi:MAG: O-antigen ligase family protein [Acidobacteria bacterium]|nr:O-antigen ligase family protein [Acidobacteriota bacterium]